MPNAPPPDATGAFFRNVIIAELASRNLSRSWLAEAVVDQPDAPCGTSNIYAYLRGSSDCTGEVLHVIFRVLDLRVTHY